MGPEGKRDVWRRLLRDDAGQALVEAALVLPVLLVLAFGVVAAGRLLEARVAVQAAAREAGRTLAAAPSLEDGFLSARDRGEAVAGAQGLHPDRFDLSLEAGAFERGGAVRAEACYRVSLADLPLFGWAEVTVTSAHTERVELYRSRVGVTP